MGHVSLNDDQMMILLGTGIVYDLCKGNGDDDSKVIGDTYRWLETMDMDDEVTYRVIRDAISYAREVISDEKDVMARECEKCLSVESGVIPIPRAWLVQLLGRTEIYNLVVSNPGDADALTEAIERWEIGNREAMLPFGLLHDVADYAEEVRKDALVHGIIEENKSLLKMATPEDRKPHPSWGEQPWSIPVDEGEEDDEEVYGEDC